MTDIRVGVFVFFNFSAITPEGVALKVHTPQPNEETELQSHTQKVKV